MSIRFWNILNKSTCNAYSHQKNKTGWTKMQVHSLTIGGTYRKTLANVQNPLSIVNSVAMKQTLLTFYSNSCFLIRYEVYQITQIQREKRQFCIISQFSLSFSNILLASATKRWFYVKAVSPGHMTKNKSYSSLKKRSLTRHINRHSIKLKCLSHQIFTLYICCFGENRL